MFMWGVGVWLVWDCGCVNVVGREFMVVWRKLVIVVMFFLFYFVFLIYDKGNKLRVGFLFILDLYVFGIILEGFWYIFFNGRNIVFYCV